MFDNKPANLDLEIAMRVDINTTTPELKTKLGLAATPEMKEKLDAALQVFIKLNSQLHVRHYTRGLLQGKDKDVTLNETAGKIIDSDTKDAAAVRLTNKRVHATLFSATLDVNSREQAKKVQHSIKRTISQAEKENVDLQASYAKGKPEVRKQSGINDATPDDHQVKRRRKY